MREHYSAFSPLCVTFGLFLCGCLGQGPEEQALLERTPSDMVQDARACDKGDMLGCSNLGVGWESHFPDRGGIERAMTLYDRACNENAWLACTNQARLLIEGPVEVRDRERAEALLSRVCLQGEATACLTHGDLLAEGSGQGDERHRLAMESWRSACAQGIHRACVEVGLVLLDKLGHNPDELHEAHRLLNLSCERGESRGCYGLARMIHAESEEGFERALNLLERACVDEVDAACSTGVELMFARALREYPDAGSLPADVLEHPQLRYFARRACGDDCPSEDPNDAVLTLLQHHIAALRAPEESEIAPQDTPSEVPAMNGEHPVDAGENAN